MSRRYWQFLLYLFIGLTAFELLLAPFRSVYALYSALIGYLGLSIEAMLPLPQIFANAQSRSCRGFRPSVLASWLAGDTMKMFWFFTSTTEIPWAFKLCGIFQAGCDLFLGLQYFMYGNGEPGMIPAVGRDHAYGMTPFQSVMYRAANGKAGISGAGGVQIPLGEKDVR